MSEPHIIYNIKLNFPLIFQFILPLIIQFEFLFRDQSASITYYYKSAKERDEDERTYVLAEPFNAKASPDHYMVRNKQVIVDSIPT